MFAELSAATVPILRNTVILAIIFTLLSSIVQACNNTQPWWRKPDLSTDLCWSILPAILYGSSQKLLIIIGIILCYGMSDTDSIVNFFIESHGPLRKLDFWPQVVCYLIGSDLIMYFTHRLFHGTLLWRFHTIHHSSKHLEWTSAWRFHPVDHIFHGVLSDVVMLLFGTPPEILIWMMPFNVGTSALVHANLNWSFGPFRYLLASPVFHRWHHTSAIRGGDKNFAGTFPLIDVLFGTFYMPASGLPDNYGLDDAGCPDSFLGQLLHPFAICRSGQAPNHVEDQHDKIQRS